MSSAGLEYYLDGARALSNLVFGSDLVVTYLEEIPVVAKECGEDIIPELVSAAMKLFFIFPDENTLCGYDFFSIQAAQSSMTENQVEKKVRTDLIIAP